MVIWRWLTWLMNVFQKASGHLFGTGFIGTRLESFNSEVLSREIGVNGFSDGCGLITEY